MYDYHRESGLRNPIDFLCRTMGSITIVFLKFPRLVFRLLKMVGAPVEFHYPNLSVFCLIYTFNFESLRLSAGESDVIIFGDYLIDHSNGLHVTFLVLVR